MKLEKDEYHMMALKCGILKKKRNPINREQIDSCQRWEVGKMGKGIKR